VTQWGKGVDREIKAKVSRKTPRKGDLKNEDRSLQKTMGSEGIKSEGEVKGDRGKGRERNERGV